MSPAQASAAAAAGRAPRRPGTARQLHREVEPGQPGHLRPPAELRRRGPAANRSGTGATAGEAGRGCVSLRGRRRRSPLPPPIPSPQRQRPRAGRGARPRLPRPPAAGKRKPAPRGRRKSLCLSGAGGVLGPAAGASAAMSVPAFIDITEEDQVSGRGSAGGGSSRARGSGPGPGGPSRGGEAGPGRGGLRGERRGRRSRGPVRPE